MNMTNEVEGKVEGRRKKGFWSLVFSWGLLEIGSGMS